MNIKKINKLYIFFSICFLQSLSANLVHPVTPTLMINLNMPSYMFGLAFSAMAFTNFLFSPFWGSLIKISGMRRNILIGCIGYAFGQFLFANATSESTIIFARLFAGCFLGAISVVQLTYILTYSTEDEKSKNLTVFATVMAVAAASGFLIGGIIGDYGVQFSFNLQVVLLLVCAVLFYSFINEPNTQKVSPKTVLKTFLDTTPYKNYQHIKGFLTPTLTLLSVVIFVSMFATVCHDQNFNYYINDVLHFSPSKNGYIKASVAILALIINIFLSKYILAKVNIKTFLFRTFLLMFVNCMLIVFISNSAIFIIINIIFYSLNILYVPLLQTLFVNEKGDVSNSIIMGHYNSLRSLGMIFGSFIAGLIYDFGNKLPFLLTSILFLVSAIILLTIKPVKHTKS